MESKEQTELKSKIEADSQIESRMTAMWGTLQVRGIKQKGKRLMDIDNSVVSAGGEGDIRRLTGNGKMQ